MRRVARNISTGCLISYRPFSAEALNIVLPCLLPHPENMRSQYGEFVTQPMSRVMIRNHSHPIEPWSTTTILQKLLNPLVILVTNRRNVLLSSRNRSALI
jgi:hypothetical protein